MRRGPSRWTPRSNTSQRLQDSYASIVRAALSDAPSPGPLLKQFEFDLIGYEWKQISVDVSVNGGTIVWTPYGYNNFPKTRR